MKIKSTSKLAAVLVGLTMTLGSCAIVAERGYYRPGYRYHYHYDYHPHHYMPYRGYHYRYRLWLQDEAPQGPLGWQAKTVVPADGSAV